MVFWQRNLAKLRSECSNRAQEYFKINIKMKDILFSYRNILQILFKARNRFYNNFEFDSKKKSKRNKTKQKTDKTK